MGSEVAALQDVMVRQLASRWRVGLGRPQELADPKLGEEEPRSEWR